MAKVTKLFDLSGGELVKTPSTKRVKKAPAKSSRGNSGSIFYDDVVGSFTPSAYQQGVYDFLKYDSRSCVVDAKAGSGKTSTMEWIANQLRQTVRGKRQNVLMLAFNKSIAEELKARMPKWIKCATFHSVGYGAWLRHVRQKVQVKSDKVRKILKEQLSEEDYRAFGAICAKLIGLAKNAGIGTYICQDKDSNWIYLLRHHCIDIGTDDERNMEQRQELVIRYSRAALEESSRMKTVIDFDDMLYMPLLEKCFFFRNDIVFVDEAQDTNNVQLALLKRMLKKEGRLVAVGDPYQAIYGFRGADSNAVDNIVKRFDAVMLPLSICYRCDKNIIIEAQKLVPEIEPFERNGDGTVETLMTYSIDNFESGDAILCRNTAPLIKFAYQIIGRGKAATVMGRDIGSGLIKLIKDLDASDLSDLTEKLDDWTDKQVSRLSKEEGNETAIGMIVDKSECIRVFMDNLVGDISIAGLCRSINALFSDDAPEGIQLATCHRSKGHEWDRGFVLDRQLMPSRWARLEWQRQQEANIEYVAITRFKHYLGFIESARWNDNEV